MPNDPTQCPGCGAAMSPSTNGGARLYQCPSCEGRLIGLSPFEKLLQDGVGARLWVAASGGEPGPRCPFCTQAMRQPAADADVPAGLAMCHTCQQVWIPASAADWINAHAAHLDGPSPFAAAATAPTECANCGAPFQPDDLGRCRYCHSQIAAPTPIVFELDQPAVPNTSFGGGLLGALASVLTEPVE
jgi:Zn-finger nucleic acid-binding protein